MSVGRPYYSDLHPDVKSEFKFRSECSLVDTRTPDQLDWLTARSSWGSITLLSSDRKKVRSAVNNKSLLKENNPTKSGNWLGYLGLQNSWNNARNIFNSFKGQIQTFGQNVRSYNATDPDYLAGDYIDTVSARTKPVLQDIKITLRDNATGTQGVLNDATVTLLIPDVEFFQDVFEPLWHRIGIHAVIEIGHSVRLDERANYGRFTGAMTNFSFDYQMDATVKVTMQFIAITEIFTEIPGKNVIKRKEQSDSKKSLGTLDAGRQTITKTTLMQQVRDLFNTYLSPESTSNIGQTITHVLNPTFEKELTTALDTNSDLSSISLVKNKTYSQEDIEKYYLKQSDKDFSLTDVEIDGVDGDVKGDEFNKSTETSYQLFLTAVRENSQSESNIDSEDQQGTETGIIRYISLGALIKLLNANIYLAWKTSNPQVAPSAISAMPEFCTSLYYPELVSADHTAIILPGEETSTYVSQSFGVLDTFTENSYSQEAEINFYENKGTQKQRNRTSRRNNRKVRKELNLTQNEKLGIIPHILISENTLQEVFDKYNSFIETMDDNDKYKPNEMSITNLLALIGLVIKENTGHAINLKLSPFPSSYVTSPDAPGLLLYRDVNAIQDDTINYFRIPLFSSSKIQVQGSTTVFGKTVARSEALRNRTGSIVRSFKLVGQLTTAMKVAAIVGSQQGSRDQAAPLMRYIYADSDEERTLTKQDYKAAAEEALERLQLAKIRYENIPNFDTNVEGLKQALKDYIMMPKTELTELNKFVRPIAPIDAELILDGTYGLRFGDVFMLDGLPPRYDNFVFYVTKISHSLVKQDWTTTISCQLRVRLK